jgi:integrase
VLTDLVGADTSIYDVDCKSCRQVMEVLRHIPPHATKRFPGKTWPEISIIARERNLKPLSPGTVNKYLASLSSLFNWAVKEELLDRNPATGLAVADTVRAKDKRLPFTDDQLKRIFSDPVFTEKDYGNRPSRYWVPLIGYYSGMRLNEICQLNAEDIRVFNDIPCFHITASVNHGVNDKVLKTPSSERVVPVLPKLLELGFDEFRRSLPITGKLCPDITMASNGYRSDTFTKYFQRFLKRCGAKSERTSFHSFRHNFRDSLRNAGVNHEIVLALGGWVGDAGIEANYGRGYSARVLREAISKVKLHHHPIRTVSGR